MRRTFTASCSAAIVALGATIVGSSAVHAQEDAHDTAPSWVAGSLGYSAPGVAFAAEGWVAPGHFVYGLHVSEIARGYMDEDHSPALSFLAGVSTHLGPFRVSVTAGGSAVSFSEAKNQSGIYPAVSGIVDLPLSNRVGLHAEHFRLLGVGSAYTINSLGLTIGNVRFR